MTCFLQYGEREREREREKKEEEKKGACSVLFSVHGLLAGLMAGRGGLGGEDETEKLCTHL